MGTQHLVMQALGPSRMESEAGMKPLPSLPSPTLSNADMILPTDQRGYSSVYSPPRSARGRPPSPTYLRKTTSRLAGDRSESSGKAMALPKKEKRGLMSRKMLLLRSRTASSGVQVAAALQQASHENCDDDCYSSSPTLMDVGNLAPPQESNMRRASASGSASGSSSCSDDMASLPQFLSKYDLDDTPTIDDELETEMTESQQDELDVERASVEERRQRQREDEHTSALLSQRAEQILANAKRRLNLMEGNLRGARDLVQPLTAANLKRATSVGSSYVDPANSYGVRNRARYDAYDSSPGQRRLQAQASAPHLVQEYLGHSRGYSVNELPERPYTALENSGSPIIANGRIPSKAQDPNWSNALRGSRSYDSLGSLQQPASREPAYARRSPDPTLEPLVEDDGQYHAVSTPSQRHAKDSQDGLGIYRPPSRTNGLREQMSSLKGKISGLRERAREDSLRRQSLQNLREPSPLNNAEVHAPEFFYTTSPAYGKPALDTNAGVGWTSPNNSPDAQQGADKNVGSPQIFTGSRNAFAEQEQRAQQVQQPGEEPSRSKRSSTAVTHPKERASMLFHKRTPSGTTIVESSRQRYSHHQQNSTHSVKYVQAKSHQQYDSPMTNDEQSEAGDTVYEDAESEIPSSVVAHEDREDAFDYKNFFLHGALAAYTRRSSTSSEGSATSTETAKGPTTAGASVEEVEYGDDEDDFDDVADIFPPPSPETPERLREIERHLHKRTLSNDSVDTLATFATATEGRGSPDRISEQIIKTDWPIPASTYRPGSRPNSRPTSRPTTAVQVKHPSPIANSDTCSERADSGVGGLPQRPTSGQGAKKAAPQVLVASRGVMSRPTTVTTPPMSPRANVDPAAVAVNALLAPDSRPLGLKDKAMLFNLVQSLSNVCHKLQEGEAVDAESRDLRRRVEQARRVLDGHI